MLSTNCYNYRQNLQQLSWIIKNQRQHIATFQLFKSKLIRVQLQNTEIVCGKRKAQIFGIKFDRFHELTVEIEKKVDVHRMNDVSRPKIDDDFGSS
jgi:hypothetical protein